MKIKLLRKSRDLLISLLFVLSTVPVFAKDKVTLPDDVQKKIASFEATKTSWYIRKASGSKAGKVVYGPYETKEQALLMWLFYDLPENKSYCIAKNETFLTKTPKIFYRKDVDSLITQVDENGLLAVLDKFFLGIEYLDVENPEPVVTDKKNTEEVKQPVEEKKNESIIAKEEVTEAIIPEEIEVKEDNLPVDIIVETPIVTAEPEVIITETIISEPTPVTVVKEPEVIKEPVKTQPAEPVKTTVVETISYDTVIDTKPKEGYTPINTAQTLSYNEEIKDFDVLNPNEKDNKGRTLLMKACETGNDWEISSLIKAGANINLKDNDGWTALMYAVRYQQNVYVVKTLIDAGADVKAKNIFNLSALIYAANYNNNPEILKLIINKYSTSDEELMQAFVAVLSSTTVSEYSLCAKAQIFIDMGLPLNNLYKGKTPLMYAASYSKSTKIFDLLMQNGAQTSIKSSEGKTAFDYAVENKSLNHDANYWALN